MKRIFEVSALFPVMIAAACMQLPSAEEPDFRLEIYAPEDATRSGYLDEHADERRINGISYIVSGSNGKVVARGAMKCDGKTSCSLPLELAPGAYDYLVVANGPDISSSTCISTALSTPVPFGTYNNASDGYCMVARGSFKADRHSMSAACTLYRVVARVCLRSVTNALPSGLGAFEPEFCRLENAVLGPYTLEGSVSGAPERGRVSERRFSGLTIPVGESCRWPSPLCHYGYPDTGLEEPTVLTIAGRVGGILYYYPLRLPVRLESNVTVSIDLTIRDLGSADPLVPAGKGSIESYITLEKWKEGNTHSSEI